MPSLTTGQLAAREFAAATFDFVGGVLVMMRTGESLSGAASFSSALWVFGYCLMFMGILLFIIASYHALRKKIAGTMQHYPLAVFLLVPPVFVVLLLIDRVFRRNRS